MRKFGLIIIGLLAAVGIIAAEMNGRVIEAKTGLAMPYVTISVMNEDSILLDGAITDENGVWRVSLNPLPGEKKVIVSASYVGYKTQYSHFSLPIKEESDKIFRLEEETEQLGEVEVKAKKPLVERQMDKLVMNVSASPFAIGSNGEDIMKKAPGVRIDKDGNITVNGKSVEIYIDGRPSYMSGEQLKGLLKGTAGSQIEKIEIITNPSAKYDASGQGGIINIKLKKNMMKGLNGMLSANYGGMYFKEPDRYFQSDYVALNLNYRSKKTYTALSLTQVYANQGVEFSSYSQQPFRLLSEEESASTPGSTSGTPDTLRLGSDLRYDVRFQYYNLRGSHDWYINDKNTLGVILNVPIMKYGTSAHSVGEYGTYTMLNEDIINKTYTEGGQSTYSPQHSVNLNYTHVFADSCSQELTANIDYNRFNSKAINFQKNRDVETLPGYESLPGLDISTDQIVNIYSAKVDFQSGFCKKGFLETGAKYALSMTQNEMRTDSTLLSNDLLRDTTRYQYFEEIVALYFTAAWQFNEKWNVKGGIRAEYSRLPYISRFDLFPTAFIGYNPSKDWRLSASYTRRIKRPNYWQLNPFRSYVSAHAYQQGYPGLQPEFNNQVDLTFGWSQYVSLSGNFAHTQDMMHMKGEVMPNGDMCSRWTNFGTCTTHGVSLSFTEIPIVPKRGEDGKVNGAWLALTLNGGYFNFISRAYPENTVVTEEASTLTEEPHTYLQRSHYANCNGTLTAYLPADIQLALDGWYSSPMTLGYQHSSASGAMGFAFKKSFPKQQLTLSLNVNDLLRSTRFMQEDTGLAEGYISRINQKVHQQSINLGLTYMFGQHQWHKWRNVGNSDEASRLGGGAGVGK